MRTRLTSLDITRHQFTPRGRGWDREEVEAFLRQIADEFEALTQELARIERRAAELAAENTEHRQRESILKETLLTAQKTAEEVRSNARREAELIVREAEMIGERLTEQARARSAEIEKHIGDLRLERRKFHARLEQMIETFQQTLEFDRERDAADSSVVTMTRPATGAGEASGS